MTERDSRHRRIKQSSSRSSAKAQLSLVEHALCPLDASLSLTTGFIYETSYGYTDRLRTRRKARARIGAVDGLSAHDELYLWGLLSLALSQLEPRPEIMATPYYCLRQLGIITSDKRGGREFELFRAALKRLAGVRYENDAFYDPVRGEHRAVSFGFLSYSLPLDPNSTRAWRFAWDPIFFEFAQASGGALSFDLALYRKLDPASRRLYLFCKKLFWRRETTPEFDMHHLAVDVLGFGQHLRTADIKAKLSRCVGRLIQAGVLALPEGGTDIQAAFTKHRPGHYRLQLRRGAAFDTAEPAASASIVQSPLTDPLRSIGFDDRTIKRLLNSYSTTLLEQWADITLAARERNGEKFFTTSAEAYFIDNIKAAAAKRRSPPDWWRELRKRERQREADQDRARRVVLGTGPQDDAFEQYLQDEAREALAALTQQLMADFQQAGQTEPQARKNAVSMARLHLRGRFRRDHSEAKTDDGFQRLDTLL